MPSLIFPKSAAWGAVVEVELGPDSILRDAYVQANRPAPAPARRKMLLDTGADRTTIHERAFAGWILTGGTFVTVKTNSGSQKRQRFDVALSILDASGAPLIVFDPLTVTLTDTDAYDGAPFDGLIGRDILNLGTFLYDGVGNSCTLSF